MALDNGLLLNVGHNFIVSFGFCKVQWCLVSPIRSSFGITTQFDLERQRSHNHRSLLEEQLYFSTLIILKFQLRVRIYYSNTSKYHTGGKN